MSGQVRSEIHSCDICLREPIFFEYKSKSYHANLCVRCLGIAISRHKSIQQIKIINTNQVIISRNKATEDETQIERVKRPPPPLSKPEQIIKKQCNEGRKTVLKPDIGRIIRHELAIILKERKEETKKFDMIPKLKKP